MLKLLTTTSSLMVFFNEFVFRYLVPAHIQKFPFGRITILLALLALVSLYFLIRKPRQFSTMMYHEIYKYIFYFRTKYSTEKINEKSNDYEIYQYEDFSKLKIALELDANTYPDEYSWTIFRWKDFHDKNKHLAYGLYRKSDTEKLHPIGGISIFPITPQAFDALRNGSLQEIDLTQEHLIDSQNEHNCRHWLIPGIVIFDRYKSLHVSILLHLFVRQFVTRMTFPAQLIALGFSDAGILILKKFKFTEVNKDGYYIRTFSSREEFLNSKNKN